MMNSWRRTLLPASGLFLLLLGASATRSQAQANLSVRLVRLSPTVIASAGSSTLTVRITGRNISAVSAFTRGGGLSPTSTQPLIPTNKAHVYSGTVTVPVNPGRRPVRVSVVVRVSFSSGPDALRTVGTLTVKPASLGRGPGQNPNSPPPPPPI